MNTLLRLTVLLAIPILLFPTILTAQSQSPRPNILWLTTEDINPHLGCYGDTYATTPNIDRMAAKGVIYTNCWSNAPVCAPARTTIISGVYANSTGAEHMRSLVPMPAFMQMYPQLLREAGYYCTNNNKEDYNLQKRGKVWDESSKTAHWKNRKPGQPFFAVFNDMITHESQIRSRPHALVHDPAKAPVPSYMPDTPEVRHDWAQYYDNISKSDENVGKALWELQEAGLADDTIVFYYGDHGSGMPRSKRYLYNSGLNAAFVVYIPPKFKNLMPKDFVPGSKSDRLVAFVDLAPTLLSLIGVKPPQWMQGHAFLGSYEDAPQEFLFGFRGRMDERYDMMRSTRDQRYVYIRNYMPHRTYGDGNAYMFQTPTTRVWKELFVAGKLTPPQSYFWETKPSEELYDLQTDHDEIYNLAASPDYQPILQRLRKAQRDWISRIRDVGFLPEGEIHTRSEGSSPYDVGHDPARYPMERIVATADLATALDADAMPLLQNALHDPDSAVRYWGAMGLLMREKASIEHCEMDLHAGLKDSSPYVRIAAAETLARFGSDDDLKVALPVLLDLAKLGKEGPYVPLAALNALDAVGPKAGSVKQQIASLPRNDPSVIPTMRETVPNLIDHIVSGLK
jgi:arylsulfatase A-like enzyme